jgi:hypothetical protein
MEYNMVKCADGSWGMNLPSGSGFGNQIVGCTVGIVIANSWIKDLGEGF